MKKLFFKGVYEEIKHKKVINMKKNYSTKKLIYG